MNLIGSNSDPVLICTPLEEVLRSFALGLSDADGVV